MEGQYRLEMKNITKRFGGVKALTDVSLKVEPGEIHALIGENGAGKSTLMKILSGAYQRDSGQIFIDGKEVKITNPKESKDLGVAIIYQEFMLAPDLTVAENIFIDKLSAGKATINWKKLRADAREQLEKLGFSDINPNAKCGSLSVAYQQVVEICKCLTRDAKILVFDEPTAVLTFSEIEKLFEVIHKLKDQGVSVIYISHRLEEIFQLSQHITVLKDGTYVDTVETSGFDKQRLVNLCDGREMTDMFPKRNAKIGDTVLKVEDLHAGKMVQGVSFEVKGGEVLGFNGLVGAGRTETINVPDFRLALCAQLFCIRTYCRRRPCRLIRPVACDNQPYGAIQKGLVLLDWQRLLEEDRIISGGTGQFHNGKEHDIYVFIVILILHDQA